MRTYVLDVGWPLLRFRRALETRALWAAEDAAREMPQLSLPDALQLVHLYAERGSPKFAKAALRWLERYLAESSPKLEHLAEVAAAIAALRARRLSVDRRDELDLEASPGVSKVAQSE